MLRTSKRNRTRVAQFNFASGYSKKRNNNFWPQKWPKTFFIQFVYSFPLKYILLPVFKKKKKIVQIGRCPADIFYFETRGPFQPTVRRDNEREGEQRTREVDLRAHATYTALTTTYNTLMCTCRWRSYCCAPRRLRSNRIEIFFCVVAMAMSSHDPARRAMN